LRSEGHFIWNGHVVADVRHYMAGNKQAYC
jgi:hypothetical protein